MSSSLCILVRDSADGKVLSCPEEEFLWISRTKEHKSKDGQWHITKQVGRDYFFEVHSK